MHDFYEVKICNEYLVLTFNEKGLAYLKKNSTSVLSICQGLLPHYSDYQIIHDTGCNWIGESGEWSGADVADVSCRVIEQLTCLEYECW